MYYTKTSPSTNSRKVQDKSERQNKTYLKSKLKSRPNKTLSLNWRPRTNQNHLKSELEVKMSWFWTPGQDLKLPLNYLADWEGYGPGEWSWITTQDFLTKDLIADFYQTQLDRPTALLQHPHYTLGPQKWGRPQTHQLTPLLVSSMTFTRFNCPLFPAPFWSPTGSKDHCPFTFVSYSVLWVISLFLYCHPEL